MRAFERVSAPQALPPINVASYYERMCSQLYVSCMLQESALLLPYFRIAAMRDESELLRADAALAVYRDREKRETDTDTDTDTDRQTEK